MRIDGCVALVTGAGRGAGAVFVRTLLARGATRVYAGARDPVAVTAAGAEPVRLDVTDPAQVAAAAAWALTNGARVELRGQCTQVIAVHSGYLDADMAAHVTAPKLAPEAVAAAVLDAVESGAEEVLADERTRQIKAALPADLETLYPAVQRAWDAAVE